MIRRLLDRVQRRVADAGVDAGFTLVEIIIAVSLLGLITGAGVTSLVTATQGSSALSLSAHESSDAQLISAFLVRDAQAAGGTDPETGITDPSLGVSTDSNAGCVPAGTLVARFKWMDRKSTSAPDQKVASYGLSGAHELVRRVCTNGVPGGDLPLGTNVANAALTCDGLACPPSSSFPKFVTLSLSGTNTANPFSYRLTAQLRSESQDPPSKDNSVPVPILALGGARCPSSGAFIDINGGNNLTVDLGGVTVNTSLAGCDGLHLSNNSTYSTDGTSVLTGPGTACSPVANCPAITGYPTPLLDPLRNLPVPPEAGECANPGTNPTKIGTHYQHGVYHTLITTNSGDTFDPGTYVFCNGLKISGDLTAPNVLLYFAGGTLDMINTPRVTLGPQASGPYQNVSIWLPKTNTQTKLTINGNSGISLYAGIVYSPATTVYVGGGAEVRIASIIAYAIVLTGNGHEVFGPGVSITNVQMDAAYIGVPYTMQLTAEGGTPYPGPPPTYSAWSISSGALPTGLSLNSAGLISGTPTALGPFTVEFQISDSIPRVTRRTYTFNVGTGGLSILTSSLPQATLTAQYSFTLQAQSDAGGYKWTATNLPAGLTLDLNTGIISGAPTGGTSDVIVTVKDASNIEATRMLRLTVNSPPSLAIFSLPETTVGATYFAPTSVSGGTAPLTWAVTNQPNGIAINGSGSLVGSAITAGNYTNVIITVTDINLAVDSKPSSLKVNPAPTITAPATPTLPGWAVGSVYPPTTMTATNGTGSYTWSAVGLPPGVTISPAGVISGTPTTAGIYNSIVVKVTDSVGVPATRPYSITITGALSIIAPTNLPSWDGGSAYPTTTATAGGGSGGYVWSSSTLPPGLVINSSTGQITGTPTTAAPASPVVLRVTDSNGVIATRPYSMTVYSQLAFTGPGSLRNWVAGTAYLPQTATVTGGSGSNTWSATGLPSGLALSPAGVLSGTPSPTSPGTYNAIIFSVDDGAGGGFNIGPYTITIFPALGINTGGVPSAGVKDVGYNGSLSPIGGSGTFSWSASGLPAGVTLSTSGVLSGSPTTVAPYTVNFTLTDNATGGVGGPPASITIPFTITINTPLAWSSALPGATARTAGFAYSRSFTTSGGLSPVTWLITGLPTGLVSSGGVISGIPTVAGTTAVTSTVTVKATDSTGQFVTHSFNLTINPTLTLAPTTAPPVVAATGASISIPYTIAGGTVPYSGLAISGPSWLSVSGNVVSGTAVLGTHSFTVTVTDAGGGSTSHNFSITVKPKVSSVALLNGTGNTAGRIEKGDRLVITFSDAVNLSSICGAWTGGAYAQNDFTVTVADGGVANDTITLASPTCGSAGMTLGSFDLSNTSFVGATASFGGNGGANQTSMSFSGNVLTITLGKASVSPTVVSNTATFSPLGNVTSVTGTIGIETAIKPAITGVFF